MLEVETLGFVVAGADVEVEGCGGPAGRLAARLRVRRAGAAGLSLSVVVLVGFDVLDSVVSSMDMLLLSASGRRAPREGGSVTVTVISDGPRCKLFGAACRVVEPAVW